MDHQVFRTDVQVHSLEIRPDCDRENVNNKWFKYEHVFVWMRNPYVEESQVEQTCAIVGSHRVAHGDKQTKV